MGSGFRWKRLKSLGEGGQGRTYLVTDTTGVLEGDHVLKECKSHEPERQRRFLREIQAIRKLRHPNLVQVVDAGEASDKRRPFYVMPYYPNGDLWSFAEASRSDPIRKLRAFERLCGAVQAAHAAGIVHRDIKPQNVVFDGNWNPILIDFGVFFDSQASDATAAPSVSSSSWSHCALRVAD